MKQGFVRIIGGKWRSRRLKVPDIKYLRPTPDRVRETIFNWLSSFIEGAYCLDAFSGSGALGFEALSRGAAYVEMVDQSQEVVTLLKKEQMELGADQILIYRANVPEGLRFPSRPFDIVFLDPPYQNNVLLPCCLCKEEHGFLAKEAHIYLEAREAILDRQLPKGWQMIKEKRAGQVAYHLIRTG